MPTRGVDHMALSVVPTLVVAALGDTDIHPAECRLAYERSAARDRTYRELSCADHCLDPAGEEGARLADPRERLAHEIVLSWLRERFPV